MKFQVFFLTIFHGTLVKTDRAFLKFGMVQRTPEFFLVNSISYGPNSTEFAGYWVNAIEWLSQRLNFRYEIIPIADIGKSEYLNGSGIWSGATGRLLINGFDILGPPIALSLSRIQVVEYAGVAEDLKSALLTPPPTEQSSILSTVRPFQPTVWMLLISSMLTVTVFFAISSSMESGRIEWKNLISFYHYLFYTVAIMTSQGELFGRKNYQYCLPFRLAAAGFCLLAVVIVNLYSSTLTSYITTRKMNPLPNGTIQVVEEGVLDYLMLNQGLGRDMILGATNGPLKKIGDKFRRNPENFIPDQETGFLKVASGCCAYSDYMSYLEFRAAKDFQIYGRCRVHIGQPISGYGFVGLLFKRSSPSNPFRNMVNQGVLEIYQAGFIDYWRREFNHGKALVCKSKENKKPAKLRQLNLQDLGSAFFVLASGIGVSAIIFLCEQFGRKNCCHCVPIV